MDWRELARRAKNAYEVINPFQLTANASDDFAQFLASLTTPEVAEAYPKSKITGEVGPLVGEGRGTATQLLRDVAEIGNLTAEESARSIYDLGAGVLKAQKYSPWDLPRRKLFETIGIEDDVGVDAILNKIGELKETIGPPRSQAIEAAERHPDLAMIEQSILGAGPAVAEYSIAGPMGPFAMASVDAAKTYGAGGTQQEIAESATRGALMQGMLHSLAPLALPERVAGSAGVMGGAAALEGASPKEVLTQAIVGGGLGAGGPKEGMSAREVARRAAKEVRPAYRWLQRMYPEGRLKLAEERGSISNKPSDPIIKTEAELAQKAHLTDEQLAEFVTDNIRDGVRYREIADRVNKGEITKDQGVTELKQAVEGKQPQKTRQDLKIERLTNEQAQEFFDSLPLKELRKRQDLADRQIEIAHKDKNIEALEVLQTTRDKLDAAVMRKEFPAEPKAMTFDEFSASRGVSRTAPDYAAAHKIPGGLSKPARKSLDKRILKDMADWQAKRDALRAEYNELIRKGEIRPPTSTEQLETTAAGEMPSEAREAAQRVLEKRKARSAKTTWFDKLWGKQGLKLRSERKAEPFIREQLKGLRDEIQSAEKGLRIFDYEGVGEGGSPKVSGQKSSFPVKDLGTKELQLRAIDKYLARKKLGDAEARVIDEFKAEIDRRTGNVPFKEEWHGEVTPIEAGNLEVGERVKTPADTYKVTKKEGGLVTFKDGVTHVVSEGDYIPAEKFLGKKVQTPEMQDLVRKVPQQDKSFELTPYEETKPAKKSWVKKIWNKQHELPQPTEPPRSNFQKMRRWAGDKWIKAREYIEDDWVRVKKLVKRPDVNVSEASNPYEKEILYRGRVDHRLNETKDRINAIDKDILKTAKRIGVKDVELQKKVNEYLLAKHAPERNARLGDGAAGMKTAEARRIIKEVESSPNGREVKRISRELRKLNEESLDILLESEVIDQKTYDKLKTTYKEHVPLQRIMEESADVADILIGRGFDVRGTGIKRAKGSTREVADIMTNIVANYEQSLMRAEKNIVDRATLKFARENKHLGLFEEIKPKVIGRTFRGGFVKAPVNDPQILVLREKGKPVYLKIKDPHLATALKGINRSKVDGILRISAAVTRLFSSLATRFNPEFAFSNKIRDLQEVAIYLAAQKEMGFKGTVKTMARDLRFQNVKAVFDYIIGRDTEGARLYRQLKSDGGTTGGLGLSTRKQVELDIEKIRKLNRSNPRKAAEMLVRAVDNWNTIFEDSTRLSVYRQALADGVSRQKSAILAKESSINFNKMGRGGPVVNSLYMFSNASIQGSAKMLRSMRDPKVAGTVLMVVATAVAASNEWNDQADPDWRDKISEWDKKSSLPIVIPSTDGQFRYIAIPVSWGLKPIKVSMDYAMDLVDGRIEDPADVVEGIVASTLDAYNPAGGTDVVSAITPTVLDLPVDLARNKGWYGSKIKPDYDPNAPEDVKYFHSLKKRTVGKTFIKGTEYLQREHGIEISPADLDYAYKQVTGGVGRFVSKAINTIGSIAKGKEVEVKEIPFMSRFYRSKDPEQAAYDSKKYEMVQESKKSKSREYAQRSNTAKDIVDEIEKLSPEEQKARIDKIAETDKKLAAKVIDRLRIVREGRSWIDEEYEKINISEDEKDLRRRVSDQTASRKIKKFEVDEWVRKLEGLTIDEKKKKMGELIQSDKKFAEKVIDRLEERALKLSSADRKIKQLGVTNGQRAQYIFSRMQNMEKEKAKDWIQELIEKKIITKRILDQIVYFKEGGQI